METKLNKVIEIYTTSFKDDIKSKIANIGFDDSQKVAELLEYVYDYDRLCLSKTDFVKRKRIKNSIPASNRCNAKRANGEQCTRRRKDEYEFCGTHSKGTPHGLILEGSAIVENSMQKMDVFAEDIQGIVYYIDNFNNVYKTEDILANVQNPKIVAKVQTDEIRGRILNYIHI
jgi:hypothetical protein